MCNDGDVDKGGGRETLGCPQIRVTPISEPYSGVLLDGESSGSFVSLLLCARPPGTEVHLPDNVPSL